MTQMELKKAKLELMKVTAARMELELRIDEYNESIAKVQTSIEIQKAKEEELTAKIAAENKS